MRLPAGGARPLSHLVPAVGYRLVEPDGRRMLPDRLAARGIAGPDVGRLRRAGRLVADGRRGDARGGQRAAAAASASRSSWTPGCATRAFELADGADMLVCESTFADADAELARDYGHLTAGQAGQIAASARCSPAGADPLLATLRDRPAGTPQRRGRGGLHRRDRASRGPGQNPRPEAQALKPRDIGRETSHILSGMPDFPDTFSPYVRPAADNSKKRMGRQ